MPASVRQGQTGVVPFSLTFTNPGGAGGSDIRLRRLRMRIEDESGAGIVPASLFTRVEVSEGTNQYLAKTALETSGADIDLTLATPVRITVQEPVTLTLRFDLSPAATQPTLRVAIVDETVFAAEDATSGAPVTVVREGGAFPVRSAVARLVADATELRVAADPAQSSRVSRGAADVPLLALRLENPGNDGITSDVRVASLGALVSDTLGVPVLRPLAHLERLVARTAFQTHAARAILASDSARVALVLSPPLTVPANTPVVLTLYGDVPDTAAIGGFRLRLDDSTAVEARDATTRTLIPARYATNPVAGPAVLVENEATSVVASGLPRFPATASVGDRDLAAMHVVLRHPSGPGTARLRLDSLTVLVRDETRAPRAPDTYLARLRVRVDGVETDNRTGLPTTGGSVPVSLGGGFVEPGDSASVDIIVDLSPTAPVSFLELAVSGLGIVAADANSGIAVRTDPAAGTEFPLLSGLLRLTSPARDLIAGWTSRLQAAVAADGRETPAAILRLSNPADPGSGAIRVDRLRLRGSAPDGAALAVGAALSRFSAYVADTLWARSDTLAADSTEATLLAAAPLDVAAGETVTIEIRATPRTRPTAPAFRVGVDAAGVGVVQPGGALLSVQVGPEAGSVFPFWTEAGSFSGATLAESWSSFPNPFAAGRQAATFVYYLAGPADVTLRIWTATGERVATVLDATPRDAGLHQQDFWDGRNGRGDVVRNGVYLAELIVAYDDGTTQRVRRKVAVVR
jgi:hypothetical protein